jgi:hypothetical protein
MHERSSRSREVHFILSGHAMVGLFMLLASGFDAGETRSSLVYRRLRDVFSREASKFAAIR